MNSGLPGGSKPAAGWMCRSYYVGKPGRRESKVHRETREDAQRRLNAVHPLARVFPARDEGQNADNDPDLAMEAVAVIHASQGDGDPVSAHEPAALR